MLILNGILTEGRQKMMKQYTNAIFSGNNSFLCKKHARQRVLRANKKMIPKGSKFKIKKIDIKEVRKRT